MNKHPRTEFLQPIKDTKRAKELGRLGRAKKRTSKKSKSRANKKNWASFRARQLYKLFNWCRIQSTYGATTTRTTKTNTILF